MADEQNRAEALDDDKIGDEFPPDRPLGMNDPTQDDRVVDSVEERAEREIPDGPAHGDRPVVVPIEGEAEQFDDGEKDLVAGAEVDLTDDDLSDEVADRASTAADRVPLPAEEAAIHLTDDRNVS